MKRLAMLVVGIVLVIYAATCAALYFGQRSLLYYPTPESRSTRAESLRFDTAGAALKIWRLAGAGDDALLYFGGNSEDVAWNIDEFAELFPDHTVYLVNYRGYGGSTGSPTEAGMLADAEQVFDAVRAEHPHVDVIGRSLGSGVAVHLATVRDVRKLVLVTPYDSVLNVAQRHFVVVPVSWLLEDRFDSLGKVSKIRIPTLALLAERDRIIPRANSERLIAAFPHGLIRSQTIAGVNHDSITDAKEYGDALRDFLRD